jgi:hypothetical protein
VVVDLTGERPTVHLPWVRTGGATLLGWNGQQRQFSIACDLLDRRGRVETVIILDGIINSAGDAMTFYLGRGNWDAAGYCSRPIR